MNFIDNISKTWTYFHAQAMAVDMFPSTDVINAVALSHMESVVLLLKREK